MAAAKLHMSAGAWEAMQQQNSRGVVSSFVSAASLLLLRTLTMRNSKLSDELRGVQAGTKVPCASDVRPCDPQPLQEFPSSLTLPVSREMPAPPCPTLN